MSSLPLAGLRVLEFTHAVMGPTAGLLLADLGAEVIHIEPSEGDATRRLLHGPVHHDHTGLVPTILPDGTATKLPRMPLEMGDYDFGLRHHPPQIGDGADALLTELGYSAADIQQLKDTGKLA